MSKYRIASNLTNYLLLIDSGLSINMLYFCRLGCSTSITGKLAEEYGDVNSWTIVDSVSFIN